MIDNKTSGLDAKTSLVPYEATLSNAFNKLTSEVLIFLLAYVILLIGMSVFASQLTTTLRELLYVIPVLGVAAYVWSQKRALVKTAQKRGINVKAGIVSGSAKIVGVRGKHSDDRFPENVNVGVGIAKGNAEVGGVVYDNAESNSQDNYSEVLTDIFRQLGKSDQINLIATAQKILDKQQSKQG